MTSSISVSWVPPYSNPSSPSHLSFLTPVTCPAARCLYMPHSHVHTLFTTSTGHNWPLYQAYVNLLRSIWCTCSHPAVDMAEKLSCIYRAILYMHTQAKIQIFGEIVEPAVEQCWWEAKPKLRATGLSVWEKAFGMLQNEGANKQRALMLRTAIPGWLPT